MKYEWWPEETLTEFASTLRSLAKLCGKSEYELANLTGLDPSFIHRLMSGEKNPSSSTVMKLAIALPTCKELAKQHPVEVPNILTLLVMAQLADASARSIQPREAWASAKA